MDVSHYTVFYYYDSPLFVSVFGIACRWLFAVCRGTGSGSPVLPRGRLVASYPSFFHGSTQRVASRSVLLVYFFSFLFLFLCMALMELDSTHLVHVPSLCHVLLSFWVASCIALGLEGGIVPTVFGRKGAGPWRFKYVVVSQG
jgi:hypothetical protein